MSQPDIDDLKGAPQRSYSDVDHDTWRRLIARQLALVKDLAPDMYWEGFARLQIPQDHLPVQDEMSDRLYHLAGWRLSNAQDEYLKPIDWFVHLSHKHFPVTDYIRPPQDIDFTPLPDLFHEYFGHLSWMTLPRYNVVVDRFARKYMASNDEERLVISNLWWFTIEFGMVRENGKVKPFGAGLLSSPGEFQYSQRETQRWKPFTIEGAAKATAKPYAFHDEYFILDGFEHLEAATAEW
jgi:phenylalanine-4-hydroxylase